MRLALQQTAYYLSNLLSLAAYATAAGLVYLGITDPGGSQVLAFVFLTAGEASLGLDGTFAKLSGGGTYEPDSWQDVLVTAVPSIALTFASLFWFVEADYVPWWTMPVLAVLMVGSQLLYINPRAGKNRPFVPVVLFGSLAYWVVVTVVLAEMVGLSVWIAPLGLFVYGLVYLRLHPERLWFFFLQSRGEYRKPA